MNTKIVALAGMLLLGSTTAHASPSGSLLDYPRVEVAYSDVNLATRAGAEIVLRRIAMAARQVCGERAGNHDIRDRTEARVCMQVAILNAVRQINARLLTALFNGRVATNSDFAMQETQTR